MKVLITGNTSALTRRLQDELASQHEIYVTSRDPESGIYLDLSNYKQELINLPAQIDVIIHCAASFKGNTVYEAMENELINSVGSFKIFEIAERTNCQHIVYISSTSTYDHPSNDYFGSYGLSKRHGQENLRYMCSENGIVLTTLMVPQIYDDKFQFITHQAMFYRIIDSAYKGQDINIYGSKDPLRNYLHVMDLTNIISKVIDKKLDGEFNCLFPRSYSISELAHLALGIFGNGGNVHFLVDKEDIGGIYIPDDNRLYGLINYSPTIDLEQGILMLKSEYEARGREG